MSRRSKRLKEKAEEASLQSSARNLPPGLIGLSKENRASLTIQGNPFFCRMPTELVYMILGNLPGPNIAKLESTCFFFRNFICCQPTIWRVVFEMRDFAKQRKNISHAPILPKKRKKGEPQLEMKEEAAETVADWKLQYRNMYIFSCTTFCTICCHKSESSHACWEVRLCVPCALRNLVPSKYAYKMFGLNRADLAGLVSWKPDYASKRDIFYFRPHLFSLRHQKCPDVPLPIFCGEPPKKRHSRRAEAIKSDLRRKYVIRRLEEMGMNWDVLDKDWIWNGWRVRKDFERFIASKTDDPDYIDPPIPGSGSDGEDDDEGMSEIQYDMDDEYEELSNATPMNIDWDSVTDGEDDENISELAKAFRELQKSVRCQRRAEELFDILKEERITKEEIKAFPSPWGLVVSYAKGTLELRHFDSAPPGTPPAQFIASQIAHKVRMWSNAETVIRESAMKTWATLKPTDFLARRMGLEKFCERAVEHHNRTRKTDPDHAGNKFLDYLRNNQREFRRQEPFRTNDQDNRKNLLDARLRRDCSEIDVTVYADAFVEERRIWSYEENGREVDPYIAEDDEEAGFFVPVFDLYKEFILMDAEHYDKDKSCNIRIPANYHHHVCLKRTADEMKYGYRQFKNQAKLNRPLRAKFGNDFIAPEGLLCGDAKSLYLKSTKSTELLTKEKASQIAKQIYAMEILLEKIRKNPSPLNTFSTETASFLALNHFHEAVENSRRGYKKSAMLEHEDNRITRTNEVVILAENIGLTKAGLFDESKLERPPRHLFFKDVKMNCKTWMELAAWWIYAKDLPHISELDIKTEDVLQHLRHKRNDLVAQCLRENEVFQRVANKNDSITTQLKNMDLRRSPLRAIASYVRYVHELSDDSSLGPEVVVDEIILLMKDMRLGIIPKVTCSVVRAEYGWWSNVFDSNDDEDDDY